MRCGPEGSRFESSGETIDFSPKVNFHNCFSVLKISMLTFQSSSQAPYQNFRAQTAALLPPTSFPGSPKQLWGCIEQPTKLQSQYGFCWLYGKVTAEVETKRAFPKPISRVQLNL